MKLQVPTFPLRLDLYSVRVFKSELKVTAKDEVIQNLLWDFKFAIAVNNPSHPLHYRFYSSKRWQFLLNSTEIYVLSLERHCYLYKLFLQQFWSMKPSTLCISYDNQLATIFQTNLLITAANTHPVLELLLGIINYLLMTSY